MGEGDDASNEFSAIVVATLFAPPIDNISVNGIDAALVTFAN